MNQYRFFVISLVLLSAQPLLAQRDYNDLNKNGRMDPYENPSASIEERVDNLISLMTLEEKVGQLQMTMGWEYYDRQGQEVSISDKFKQDIRNRHSGSTWALMRADPWTQKDFSNGLDFEKAGQLTQEMQQWVRDSTRLGIPIFFAEECPHGLMALNTMVFPTAIGRASSFNVELERIMGMAVAVESSLHGVNIAFGPVADIARDPRWSRMEEGYGEDPVLTAVMASQYVWGLQSAGLIATMKHFSAYGVSEGGHNGASAHVGNRELLSVLSYPFMKSVQNGLKSLMTSYNDVDGIPCSGNEWLMKEVLRDSWKFNGLVISDLYAINGLVSARVAADYSEAAAMAVRAGVNIDLGASCYGEPLIEAVRKGLVTEAQIDEVLRPVLTAKYEQGLFDDTRMGWNYLKSDYSIELLAAEQSAVLLKNENKLLPLSKTTKRIAVIGPNADNMYNMLGDYTAPQQPEAVITLLEGVRQVAPKAKIDYVKGCGIRDTSWQEINRAVEAAQKADVVIIALGGSSARDFETTFQKTGAAEVAGPTVSDMECGEGFDRATLDLMGYQQELLEAVCATGKPVVLVLIQGRPLNITWADEHVTAILNAWYPGAKGGLAIANILFGETCPSGHLPVTYPRSAGQLPVYYNTISVRRDYTDASAQPLYPFGYGLSYTTFEYGKPVVSQTKDSVKISFTIANTGDYDGMEVVQLYVTDKISSVMLPERQLKQFQKVGLKKGESKEVEFILTDEDFALLNGKLEWVVEPGGFDIHIGPSSVDSKIELTIERP
ncbi:MAG: glycoside hydrolase family 3 C-terminal domain-containing protein [Bacteroidales bacterium]|nr:glycoside hydrolase family 3 C-terminal domain-containing protein [Bacteroidales bacterium]